MPEVIKAPKGFDVVPLFDRILLRRDTAEQMTEQGIHIPDQAKARPNTATVLAVGEGRLCIALPSAINHHDPAGNGLEQEEVVRCHVEPLRVRVGDKVLIPSYVGSEVSINDETLILVREDDVLAILNPKVTPNAPDNSPNPAPAD